MADNFQKLWLQSSLNQMAISRAQQEIQRTGRALPCVVKAVDGSIVTVSFEVQGGPWTLPMLTLPKQESQWMRAPTQVGDFGVTAPADTYLGGVSGVGGVADLTVDYGNLTTLMWVPIASTDFGAAPDPNKAWVNGPNGAIVSDTDQTVGIIIDKAAGTVTIYAGDQTIVIDNDPSITTTVLNGSSQQIQTIVDGSGNAISHVLPTGGILGLGALASSLGSTRAVPAQADLKTLSDNLIATSLQRMSVALGAAAVSTSLGPGAAAFSALIGAAGFITGLSGINPTIPSGSSIARVAP